MTVFECLHRHSKDNGQGTFCLTFYKDTKLNFPIVLASPKAQHTVNLIQVFFFFFFFNCSIQDQSEIIICDF